MSRINDDSIGTGIDQCLHTVERVNSNAHSCGHTQAAFLVLAGHRLILGLGDVLIGNQSYQVVVLINDGQFLNLVLLQYLCGSKQVSLLMRRHQIILRHDFIHGTIQSAFKAEVTIGNDAYQVLFAIHYGDAADMVFRHDVQCLCHRRSEGDGHGVVDHAVLGTLDDSHLAGLVLYRHILVNNANTAFTGNGNSHLAFRHRVHGCRHEGDIQFDMP